MYAEGVDTVDIRLSMRLGIAGYALGYGAAALAPYRQYDVPPDLIVADVAAQRSSITFHAFALNVTRASVVCLGAYLVYFLYRWLHATPDRDSAGPP